MNIVLEDITPCRKRLKIEVPANRVSEERGKVAEAFQHQVKIPGFRPGKTPKGMVEKRFAKDIDEELKRVLVPDAFREAVKNKKLRVVSAPQIEDLQYQTGTSLSFSTVVELAPEFPMPDYKSIKIEKKEASAVTDADVEETIKKMLVRFGEFKTVEREAREGDYVVIDYSATLDGKSLKEAIPDARPFLCESKDFWLWLKSNIFLPGFSKQMEGCKAGETREVTVDFPEDSQHESVRGKKVLYKAEVREVKESILPELTDAFCQENFKMPLDQVRQNIRSDIEQAKNSEVRAEMRKDLVQQLLNLAKFDLPEGLVQQETQRLIYDIVTENQMRGIPENMIQEKKDEIFNNATASAKERVKLGFVLGKIAEEEKIDVTQQELTMELHYLAQRYNMTLDKIIKQIRENNSLYMLEEQILNRKTIEHLLNEKLKN